MKTWSAKCYDKINAQMFVASKQNHILKSQSTGPKYYHSPLYGNVAPQYNLLHHLAGA